MSLDACLSGPAFQAGKRRLRFPTPLSILVATDGATSLELVPTTYILNREGVIVGAGYGPVDLTSPEFAQFLESVLSAS
jgi:hypothetical protein